MCIIGCEYVDCEYNQWNDDSNECIIYLQNCYSTGIYLN